MKLTVSNANISNTFSTARMTLANTNVVESISLGSVSITPAEIDVGNVVITPTTVSVPSLVLGGIQFTGGQQGGIINYQEFTANGTWYNPYANASVNSSLTGYEQVFVMMWGGGGGGDSTDGGTTGGGGACFIGTAPLNSFTNTCSVNVGVGGTTSGTSTNGGNSIFVINSTSTVTAYGGSGGLDSLSGSGAGSGVLGIGASGTGGAPLGGASGTTGGTSTFGGGGGAIYNGSLAGYAGGVSIFGGGGGGGRATAYNGPGGASIYGGGGGGVPMGNSVFGGAGANGTSAAQAPGGGGFSKGTISNGARGEVRVWVFGPAGTTAGAPTYSLTANTTTLYETFSVLYTISTTNVANGTTLYYTLNNSSTAVSSDFSTAVNGSVIINGGTGTFTLTANNDTDSANEAFQIDVRTGSESGSIVASNGSVSIVPLTVTLMGSATSSSGANSTNLSVSLPTGIQAGELLLVSVGCRDDRTFTWPTGWTEIDDQKNGFASSGTIGYRIATGSEGSTITISASSSTTVAAVALRLSGNYIIPPNISNVATSSNNSPDSSSVSLPSGSAGFYISTAVGRLNSLPTTLTSPPSGYTTANSIFTNADPGAFCIVATKTSSVSPENPGNWILNSTTSPNWLAWTIAI